MTGAEANLFAAPPGPLPRELVEVLGAGRGCRLERIVSTAHATPPGQWYDQPAAEWVAVLRGSAGLRFEDESAPRTLGPGDHVLIAPRRRHRVEWTDPDEPTIWLAVHYDAGASPISPASPDAGTA
jgi:cupin 2 domain-containing protein